MGRACVITSLDLNSFLFHLMEAVPWPSPCWMPDITLLPLDIGNWGVDVKDDMDAVLGYEWVWLHGA